MKVDRRSFLSLLIGGAAGTTLTPLPWKLTDDLSIWTQNWPWTPVPPRGEASYAATTCTLCPGGCGVKVRKIDDRCVKIEGSENHPLNRGGICILGLSGLQLLYGPTRIKSPLKRIGQRGQGQWEAVSWQEAIGYLAGKLSELRSKAMPEMAACIVDDDKGTVGRLLKRFMKAFGSPNFATMPTVLDTYRAWAKLTQGSEDLTGFDMENADFILSFGCGLLDGWGSPVHVFKANSAWKSRHATLVQIEPRLSNTAAKAEKWLAIKPGSETDLAMAMANLIVNKGLYHPEFVSNYCEGLAELQALLEPYSLDAAATATGLAPGVISRLAVEFAKAERPLALFGKGQGRTAAGSLKECSAVMLLNALTGAINRQGGVLTVPDYDYIRWPEPELDEEARAGMRKQRLDGAGSGDYVLAESLAHRMLTSEQLPEILMLARCNPLFSLPDSNRIGESFSRIPLIVSFSSFMDETAAQADLILPEHTFLERLEDVPVTAGINFPVIGLCQPVVDPLLNTKALGDTIIELAGRMGGSVAAAFGWDDYESCLKEALEDKWEDLEEKGFWSDDNFSPSKWAEGFQTANGKFRLAGGWLSQLFQAEEISLAGDTAKYPLILVPYDSIRLANGYIGDPPFVIKSVSDDVLKGKDLLIQINPATAEKYGLSEGSLVKLATPVGSAVVRVHLDHGTMPGILAAARGLGHSAYDDYLAGKGINVNALIGSMPEHGSGFDAVWGIRAKLAKA